MMNSGVLTKRSPMSLTSRDVGGKAGRIRMRRLTWFTALLLVCLLPYLAQAQGRPDIVWMRGGSLAEVGKLGGVVYTPDGQTIAAACTLDNIKLWRVSDGILLRTINAFPGNLVRCIAMSPDGQTLAAGGEEANGASDHASDYGTLQTVLWSAR